MFDVLLSAVLDLLFHDGWRTFVVQRASRADGAAGTTSSSAGAAGGAGGGVADAGNNVGGRMLAAAFMPGAASGT